ncbi:hypothetical protein [Actinoplanes sp. NPDC049681]|uniref:hypothetical protein n=1 Tax=Actinoplanes sp. NPDC049681 TaxID=3363905 RepID=UPI0037A738AD
MSGQDLISLAALTAAIIATATSSLLAWQALRVNQNMNHIPVVLEILKPHRTPEFVRKEIAVWDEISKHDAALGFFALPEPIRSYAIEVGTYYQVLSYTSLYGIADGEFIAVQTQHRLLRSWDCLREHVNGERALRGSSNTFLNAYEEFARQVADMDIDAATRRLVGRSGKLKLK